MAAPVDSEILHKPGAPAFLNARFMAPNVFEIAMPADLVAHLACHVEAVRRMDRRGETYPMGDDISLHCERPLRWRSDICWLSHADEPSYRWFERIYDRLGVADRVAGFVPHDRVVRLYSGFFVTRSRCDRHDFHADWVTPENRAFTLLAPLSGNAGEMGLTYIDVRGAERNYAYPAARALVFGAGFRHSTAIGSLDERAVYLCFNFGTDRMELWPELEKTAGRQGNFYCLPDGTFASSGGEQTNA